MDNGVLFEQKSNNFLQSQYNFIAYDQKIYEDFILAFVDYVKVLAAFYCGVPISAALFIIYGDGDVL